MQLSAFARDAGFQIAWSIARRIGTVPRPGFELAFQAQVQREVGDAPDSLGRVNNNPLNLTAPTATYWPGQTGFASGGSATEQHTNFAVFGTLQDGVEAAATNYMAASYAGVRNVIAAGGDAVLIARAISASPWSTDHYPDLFAQVQELQADQAAAAVGPGSVSDDLATYKIALQKELEAKAYAPITQLQLDVVALREQISHLGGASDDDAGQIADLQAAVKRIDGELAAINTATKEGGYVHASQETTPAAS